MISYDAIGKNIRAARIKGRKTQKDIATQINVSTAYYGKIERGETQPNLARLLQLSNILSTPMASFLVGAVALHSYNDLPPPTEPGEMVLGVLNACSEEVRDVIVQVCKLIAGLSS